MIVIKQFSENIILFFAVLLFAGCELIVSNFPNVDGSTTDGIDAQDFQITEDMNGDITPDLIPDDLGSSSLVWRLNGDEIARIDSVFAKYYCDDYSCDFVQILFSVDSHNAIINIENYSTTVPKRYSCADFGPYDVNMILQTMDSEYVNLENLPEEWKNITFQNCDESRIDTVEAWVQFDQLEAQIVGSCQWTIIGDGLRQGDTLVVDGIFNSEVFNYE